MAASRAAEGGSIPSAPITKEENGKTRREANLFQASKSEILLLSYYGVDLSKV